MRLVLVDLGHAWGGAQRWALRLAGAWLAEDGTGRSLHVISPHTQFSAVGATLTQVSGGRGGLKAAGKILKQRDECARVILLNSFPAVYLGFLPLRGPIVAWLHEPLIGPATPAWKRPAKLTVRAASLLRAQRVICVGNDIRSTIPSAFAGRSDVILNGVADHSVAHRQSSGTLRVAFIGRLDAVKRVHLLIAAVERLRHMLDRPVSLVIAGDGPERLPLEHVVHAAGLADIVTFLGEVSDAQHVLADCDVFVLPSSQEGLPLTILEAFAGRRPVVGFAVPGVRELVRDGETGILCPDGDVAALADALRRLAGDTVLADRLSDAARRVWETRHREEFMIERSLNLLHDAATGSSMQATAMDAARARSRR